MSKQDLIEFDGEVIEVLPRAMFRVKLDNNHVIIAYLSGKMRTNQINIVIGDRVRVEFSMYDPERGRITYRNK